MKNTKKIVSIVLAFSITVGLTGCKMVQKTPESVAKSKVAKVNGKVITRGEIDDRLAFMHAALKEKFGEKYEENSEAKEILQKQREQLLQVLVSNEIILKKSKDLKVKVTDEEINKKADEAYKQIKANFPKEEDYKKALEKEKLTEEKLKSRIKEKVQIELTTNKLYESVTKDVKVDEKEMKEHYNKNVNDFTEKPNGVKLAQIVVEKKEEAEAIKKKLDGGADFAKIAKEKSKDEMTKSKGGEIGFLTYRELYQKPYLTSTMTLKKDEVTAPVQDEDGFHIVKVLDKTDYPAKKYEEVKERINEKLIAEKKLKTWEENMKKWKEEVKAKTYEDNLK